ncbi:MAG: hypothetical protein ABII09_11965 [Planctomycetota bacterium]
MGAKRIVVLILARLAGGGCGCTAHIVVRNMCRVSAVRRPTREREKTAQYAKRSPLGEADGKIQYETSGATDLSSVASAMEDRRYSKLMVSGASVRQANYSMVDATVLSAGGCFTWNIVGCRCSINLLFVLGINYELVVF